MSAVTEDLKTFEKRVRRIDPDHNPTTFRRWWRRERRPATVPLRRSAFVLVFAYLLLTGVKVVMVQDLGAAGFDTRVATLAAGNDAERIAARLLFRDPLMTYLAERV
ncbi:MAG: hypothetical protein AAF631_00525 [Pseudomonadota bacterium]